MQTASSLTHHLNQLSLVDRDTKAVPSTEVKIELPDGGLASISAVYTVETETQCTIVLRSSEFASDEED